MLEDSIKEAQRKGLFPSALISDNFKKLKRVKEGSEQDGDLESLIETIIGNKESEKKCICNAGVSSHRSFCPVSPFYSEQ